jgi:hypothetical protein
MRIKSLKIPRKPRTWEPQEAFSHVPYNFDQSCILLLDESDESIKKWLKKVK